MGQNPGTVLVLLHTTDSDSVGVKSSLVYTPTYIPMCILIEHLTYLDAAAFIKEQRVTAYVNNCTNCDLLRICQDRKKGRILTDQREHPAKPGGWQGKYIPDQ